MGSKYTSGFNHGKKNFQGGKSKIACTESYKVTNFKLIVQNKSNWFVILGTNKIYFLKQIL